MLHLPLPLLLSFWLLFSTLVYYLVSNLVHFAFSSLLYKKSLPMSLFSTTRLLTMRMIRVVRISFNRGQKLWNGRFHTTFRPSSFQDIMKCTSGLIQGKMLLSTCVTLEIGTDQHVSELRVAILCVPILFYKFVLPFDCHPGWHDFYPWMYKNEQSRGAEKQLKYSNCRLYSFGCGAVDSLQKNGNRLGLLKSPAYTS